MNRSWLINLVIVVLNWIPLIHGTGTRCEYKSIEELIKTSPIILKALGARIFADIDERTDDYEVVAGGIGGSDNDDTKNVTGTIGSMSSTLITLTPSTIYKGASLLKFAPTFDGAGEYYHYEGQINATVEPLACFVGQDNGTLNILPTELIVFGKLDNERDDILIILVNGLHRWGTTFENRIWKHLGWDDWSDFTPCSVMCAKGVQQRFRRCLLDSRPTADSGYVAEQHIEYYRPPFTDVGINMVDQRNIRNYAKYGHAARSRKRRKKKAKVLTTTQSCEGYNIEQRSCNLFECGDNITDLLKFYKRTTSDENLLTISPIPTSTFSARSPRVFQMMGPEALICKWENSLNFTIMMTLKVKTRAQLTLLSLRNATRNLYLDQSPDGLKLFQERSGVTEMLPIKVNLYDNRWHQIAISVHNGDFIVIYVDCLWTDSFIVSKGLFILPDSADVLVGGRNFYGDFQQLIIMPGNHEKLQCSNTRAPINEVKRYIIDTFIEDESN